MTNTQTRITGIYAAADRAGLSLELKQGLWQQLGLVGTTAGRDSILTRWEQCAKQWPDQPVTAEQRVAVSRAQLVI